MHQGWQKRAGNWRKELQAILRNYCIMPHATTSVAPAVLLLKCPVPNKLPQANHIDPLSQTTRKHDSSQKSKIKAHADSKTYVKPCTISLGDTVSLKRPLTASKGGTVYHPTPMTVVGKSQLKVKVTLLQKNSSFFKSLNQPAINRDNDESQSSGFCSPSNKECICKSPAAAPGLNAPDPAPPKFVKTSYHDQSRSAKFKQYWSRESN